MLILGINSCSHDASLSVIENGEILFAGHSERYSKKKNDSNINDDLLSEALSFGKPEKIAYYEKPALKAIRKSLFGGFGSSFDELNSDLLPSEIMEIIAGLEKA